MTEITMERLQELMENAEFVAKMKAAKTSQSILKVLNQHGIEITAAELAESAQQVIAALKENGYMDGDELNERGLELVSGGFNWGHYGGGIGLMVSSLGAAACPPVALLALGIGGVWALYGCFSN